MAESDTSETQAGAAPELPMPSLAEMQHWTWVMGRAQQMMMEHLAEQMGEATDPHRRQTPPRSIGLAADELVRRSGEGGAGAGGAVEPRGCRSGSARWAAMAAGPELEAKRPTGQALRRPGMARQSLVRHDPPDLSAGLRADAGLGRRDRGRGRRDPREDAVHDAGVRRRDVAVQFRADQSAGDRARGRDQGREPAQGPRAHAPGPRQGTAHPYRPGRVRGRAQHRGHPRQGGQADPPLPADPVQPDDRPGAGDAADHLPALDQPLSTSSTSTRRRASSAGRSTRG